MTTPTCLAGHGPMLRVPGLFALNGGQVEDVQTNQGLLGSFIKRFNPNGQMYSVQVWKCATCYRVELFDEDDA